MCEFWKGIKLLPDIFLGFRHLVPRYHQILPTSLEDYAYPQHNNRVSVGVMKSDDPSYRGASVEEIVNQRRRKFILRDMKPIEGRKNVFLTSTSVEVDFNLPLLNDHQTWDSLQTSLDREWSRDQVEFCERIQKQFESEKNKEGGGKCHNEEEKSQFLADAIVREKNTRLIDAVKELEFGSLLSDHLRYLEIVHNVLHTKWKNISHLFRLHP
eukprot:TRINITY_DN6374_c0_g1_i4.p1 TRINITY_DN6374_c0_g1~~TRINITY_DN6374_c0_g1_i4.p1  ORF type:complete len:212 (+),score=29.17 TRINITY_DN6374_c0_g1_i4:594-1229(+)